MIEGLTPATVGELAGRLAPAVEGKDSYAVCDVLLDLQDHYYLRKAQYPGVLQPLQVCPLHQPA